MPIKAFYHSTCGGITEGADRVFGERAPGVSGGVQCGYCGSSPRYRWSFEVPPAEIAQALGFRVREVRVVSRWGSGRARSIELVGEGGRRRRLPAVEFRHRLGAERLRSTAFEVVRQASGGFRFEGRGNGHGVGMCQWGAKEMGERGTHHARILSHYYPASQIRRVW
jgi:stage II sporulation protein D